MMKKTLTLTILLALFGCSNIEEPTLETLNETSNPETSVQTTAPEPELVGDLNVIFLNRSWLGGVGHGDGFYFTPDPWFTQIKYIDFATGVEIYLTNRPDLIGTGENLLGLSGTPVALGLGGTSLYALTRDEFQEAPPALYRMNLDGSNPQRILQFGSETQLDYQMAMIGDFLYFTETGFVEVEISPGFYTTMDGARNLNRANLSTGQIETLHTTVDETLEILGVHNENIIFSLSGYFRDEDNLWENDRALWLEMLNQQEGGIFTIAHNELELLMDVAEMNRHQFMLHGNQLIFTHNQRGAIEYLNLDTHETGTIASGVPNGDELQGLVANYLIYQSGLQMVALNLQTGSVTPVNMPDGYHATLLGSVDGKLIFNVAQLGALNADGTRDILGNFRTLVEIGDFISGSFGWQAIEQL